MAISKKEKFLAGLLHWIIYYSHNVNGEQSGLLGRNYKEKCNETRPCNPIKFLDCNRGICECIEPREMIFNQEFDGCSALAGFSCLSPMPGQKKTKRSNSRNETKIVPSEKYQIACAPNARCSYPEERCKCEFRYYKASNGTCLHQKSYGERCSADEQCDKFKFLNCIQGTCTCDRNHRYDERNDKCMVQIGARCKTIDYKTIHEERYLDDECPQESSCKIIDEGQSGVCECDPTFKVTLDGTCGRPFGNKCSAEDKCSDVQFICRSGTCQCKYPLHQYYNEEEKRCISFAGGPCDIPRSNINPLDLIGCSENALCSENGLFSICKCKPGFIETNEGKCVKAFGSRCELDLECDPLPSLACINNVCNCADKLQVYDEKTRFCVSLVGGRCRVVSSTSAPSCTPNAACVKASGLDYGKCTCARGMQTTINRLCAKGS